LGVGGTLWSWAFSTLGNRICAHLLIIGARARLIRRGVSHFFEILLDGFYANYRQGALDAPLLGLDVSPEEFVEVVGDRKSDSLHHNLQ
jgi:hypothetical protein